MRHNYFKINIDAMRKTESYKVTTFDRQAVIDDIDILIRQLKITKAGISGALDNNYRTKRHVAEWLFADSKQLDDIIEKITAGGYDND